jgi:peptide/nickel transport system permease protein
VIRYIIRRLLWVLLVLVVVVFLTFVIFFKLPSGNPALRFAGKNPSPVVLAQVTHQFGLDKPWYTQYVIFTKNIFLGDKYGWPGFGISFALREPLKDVLWGRLLVTAQMAIGAAIIWLAIGLPIGILSALRPRSIFDRIAMITALVFISAPVFFLGPLALYIFYFKMNNQSLGTGYYPLSQYGFGPWFSHWILPWVVLALLYAAEYARMERNTLMETMSEDYIRTARAKGLSERRVVLKHGLRASLTPVVTLFGLDFAQLLGGAIITETIFNLPGIGQFTFISLKGLDLYALVDITLFLAFFVAMANLIVDIAYAFLDPRVRYS